MGDRPGTGEGEAPAAKSGPAGLALPPGCPLGRDDVTRFLAGEHDAAYRVMGAQRSVIDGREGTAFSVWAPAAAEVSVVGGFNDWTAGRDPLERLGDSGLWTGRVGGVSSGQLYKYRIRSKIRGLEGSKSDPFAVRCEAPPRTASVVWDLDYAWGDAEWIARRGARQAPDAPMSVYELHLGSWRRSSDAPDELPRYRQIADELVPYLERMGFTHVEVLPITEHPFYGSWGYQTTGYFAATSRYGTPQDLMYLIDRLHQAGIGVILDWVPSHFPSDGHGLAFFDGTYLYEHADPRKGYHPDWHSCIFDYGRPPVVSFLVSSALFWLDRYHIDGLRVDAVASLLYLDYSRKEGEWVPNRYGGRENLEAIDFIRRLTTTVHARYPDVRLVAEESTSWPMVSRPVHLGGLGFDQKWDMGWMHDTLDYFKLDPIHRKFHHGKLTFRQMYSGSEDFVLALSHDEVVHGKGSLLGKMPGDYWQRFASLRALYGYMYGQSGKKLLFMGAEIGQWREWDHESGLEWHLLDYPIHAGLQAWVAALNRAHREEPALHQCDFDPRGFRWIDCADAEQSVFCFTRHGQDAADLILVVCNFTPIPRYNYRVGVPREGVWREILNSDAAAYGGSGLGNPGRLDALPIRYHDLEWSLNLTLPPLGALFLKPARGATTPPPGDIGDARTRAPEAGPVESGS